MNFDLVKEMRRYGYQKDIAKQLDVSAAYVSAMQTGKKPASDELLRLLGWERIVTVEYREKEPK